MLRACDMARRLGSFSACGPFRPCVRRTRQAGEAACQGWPGGLACRLPTILGTGPFLPSRPINALAFSPDGKLLVTVTSDISSRSSPRLCIWDAATGKALRQLDADDRRLAFSPDSKTMYSGPRLHRDAAIGPHHDGFVHVWDLATGRQIHKLPALLFALWPDGKLWPRRLSIQPTSIKTRRACWRIPSRYIVKLFDTTTWKENPQFREKTHWPASMTFSNDGRTLACGTAHDGSIELWDLVKFKKLPKLAGPEGAVLHIAFSPDDKTLASTNEIYPRYSKTKTIVLWDWAASKERCKIDAHPGPTIERLAFTRDGKQLILGRDTDGCRFWDIATGQPSGKPLKDARLGLCVVGGRQDPGTAGTS